MYNLRSDKVIVQKSTYEQRSLNRNQQNAEVCAKKVEVKHDDFIILCVN